MYQFINDQLHNLPVCAIEANTVRIETEICSAHKTNYDYIAVENDGTFVELSSMHFCYCPH